MSQEKQTVLNAIQAIRENTELFYQQKTQEAYIKMQDTINFILQAVEALNQYAAGHEGFAVDSQRLVTSLTEAMNAMEEKDEILLADILEYDFVEYLQELTEEME